MYSAKMMFTFFRCILIFWGLVQLVLAVLALLSSYKKGALDAFYVIEVTMTRVNLGAMLDASNFGKRADTGQYLGNCAYGNDGSYGDSVCTSTLPLPLVASGSLPVVLLQVPVATTTSNSAATPTTSSAPTSSAGPLQATVQRIARSMSYRDLGLADVYSVSLWGYCRGSLSATETITDGVTTTHHDASSTIFTWCSRPRAAFAFDPATVLKAELQNKITSPGSLSGQQISDLSVLMHTVNSTNLRLPGSLNQRLDSVKRLSRAAFGLTLALVVLVFLSVVIDVFGCWLSPGSCCLSFLNFAFEASIWVLNVVAAGVVTGTALYVKSQISDDDRFGLSAGLSKGFYGFIWAAAVAGWLVIVFSLLGHCCGLFNTHRRYYRQYKRQQVE